MNPEVQIASAPPDSRHRFSRRSVLAGMLAIPGLRLLEKRQWYDSLSEYQRDFRLVSDEKRMELLGQGSFERLEEQEVEPGTSDTEILNLKFTKAKNQLVLLHFQGLPDKQISAPVIFADIGDRTHHVTILRTPHTAEQLIAVHTAEEGENTVRIRRTEASEDLDFDNLFVTARIAKGFSPIYEATLQAMGEIDWRGDNAFNYYRSDATSTIRQRALTNDSAFFTEMDILEHEYDRNLIMVQINRGARSESPRSPENLFGEVKRLYDYDPIVFITMNRQGHIYKIGYQTDTTLSHQVKDMVFFSNPVPYYSEEIQRNSRFHEIQNRHQPGTGHGMIGPGPGNIVIEGKRYQINTGWSIVPRTRPVVDLKDNAISPEDREIELARQTIAVRANINEVVLSKDAASLDERTQFLKDEESRLTTNINTLIDSASGSTIKEIPIFN